MHEMAMSRENDEMSGMEEDYDRDENEKIQQLWICGKIQSVKPILEDSLSYSMIYKIEKVKISKSASNYLKFARIVEIGKMHF